MRCSVGIFVVFLVFFLVEFDGVFKKFFLMVMKWLIDICKKFVFVFIKVSFESNDKYIFCGEDFVFVVDNIVDNLEL